MSPTEIVAMLDQPAPGMHAPTLPGYAQASQDLFALWVCGKSRTYLELGAFHPVCLSNTLLLEQYGWHGESLDIDGAYIADWRRLRRNFFVVRDALDGLTERIERSQPDYVSLDVDESNMSALLAMLKAKYRPACLTVETNEYEPALNIAEPAAEILKAAGYMTVARQIKVCGMPFESWWVHESVADASKYRLADGLDHRLLANMMLDRGLSGILTSTVW